MYKIIFANLGRMQPLDMFSYVLYIQEWRYKGRAPWSPFSEKESKYIYKLFLREYI